MYGWHTKYPENIPVNLSYWLTKVNHLKLALTQHGLKPALKLIGHRATEFCPEETQLLATDRGWMREIYLAQGDIVYTYGRTLIPATTYQAFATEFDSLKEQAIGEVMLHNKVHVSRGHFEFGIIAPNSLLFERAVGSKHTQVAPRWGRRSFFYIAGFPLLIIEIFLDVPTYDPQLST